MKILIVGDGKVGYTLAEQLSAENHDVTIVDNNVKALNKAVEKLDVLCVRGSASSKTTLMEAGVADKDIVIAVTSSDEINMVCALLTNKLSDAKVIARIRNPEYAESEDFIKDTLGIDMCVNPELSAAGEISRLLRYSYAHSVDVFAQGRLELIEVVLGADSPLLGRGISELMPKVPAKVLICLVIRSGASFTAKGGTVLREGDHIFAIGTPHQNVTFIKYLGISNTKLKNVMIVGGSRIAHYLAMHIQKLGMVPKIIELDAKRCEELYQRIPDTLIINGDGTDHELLDQEQIADMDAFVALTDRDEENILAGLYAKDCDVHKVVVKVTRPYYARITEGMSTISPKDLTASRIVRYIRGIVNSEGSFVERLYRIAQGYGEALEFTAGASAKMLNIPMRNLDLKEDLIIAAIIHKGRVVIPFGNDMIREGDKVIIVVSGERVFLDINDILRG